METEVWPELTAACAERGIPLVLANARLNENSLASAERLGWLARPAYSSLAAVWAQTEADSHRLVSLGAKVEGVFGNLKFDATPDARQLATASAAARPAAAAGGRCSRARATAKRPQLLEVLKRFGALAPVPPEQDAMQSIAQPRARRAMDDRAAPSAALRRGRGAGRVAWLRRGAPQHRRRAGRSRDLARRFARRDGAVLRPGRRGAAGRQLRAAGRPEPDRGGGLRLPGGHGPLDLQLRRGRRAVAGGRRLAARRATWSTR